MTNQEMIEHNENKQGQSEKQGAQEILDEQGHENEQQQKTCTFVHFQKMIKY